MLFTCVVVYICNIQYQAEVAEKERDTGDEDESDSDQENESELEEEEEEEKSIPSREKSSETAQIQDKLQSLRLGNTEPIVQKENDSEDEDEQEDEQEDEVEELEEINNRDYKAHRDENKTKPRKRATAPLTEDTIKDRVSRSLRKQESRQNYKQHVRRNQVKGKEKRRNRDVVKSATKGTGSIFD